MSAEWSLSSYKSKVIAQDVNGIFFISVLRLTNFHFNQDVTDPNPDQLSSILSKLEHLPPLIYLWIESLQYQLSLVQWKKEQSFPPAHWQLHRDTCTQQIISSKSL
ncbi:hypothetical protein ARMGADRAFT_760005 [Armillaria gallica]|uniref:Uncharacterized protein n=1 Tax=Armillaria gallica TaxID=47427 RepID=A0A2H3E4F1_ARMGA|nr:hypothetical protein ARMGADRAFT_760005 [Armillaria gallica]